MKHWLLWILGALALAYAAWRATGVGIAIWLAGILLILGGVQLLIRPR